MQTTYRPSSSNLWKSTFYSVSLSISTIYPSDSKLSCLQGHWWQAWQDGPVNFRTKSLRASSRAGIQQGNDAEGSRLPPAQWHSGTVAQAGCRTFTRYDIQNIAAKHAHRSCGQFMQGCKLPKSEPGHIRQPWPGYQRHVWWLAHACCPGTSFVCGTYAPSPWRAMHLLCRTFWGPIFFLYAIHCR